jgi:NADPH:quinone reductase-like Zn-dependent oxidoreductase
MKAICVSEFGDPEVLKLEDMPDPRPPQSGGILVSVNAAGVTEASYAQKMRDWQRFVSASIRYVCDETTG